MTRFLTIKRYQLFVLILLAPLLSYGQMSFMFQTGMEEFDHEDYKWQPNHTLGLQMNFNKYFSVGLGYSFMPKYSKIGNKEFFYCDSFSTMFHRPGCLPGHDTMVYSDYRYRYKKSSLSIYVMGHLPITDRLTLSAGFNIGALFYSRTFMIENDLFPDAVYYSGVGFSTQWVTRLSSVPYPGLDWLKFYLEYREGFARYPTSWCTDTYCSNFEKGKIQTRGIHIGLVIALSELQRPAVIVP